MKRFIIYYYWGYYPIGGMADYLGDVETLEELAEFVNNLDEYKKLSIETEQTYLQIADLHNKKYKEFSEIPTKEQLENFDEYEDIKRSE